MSVSTEVQRTLVKSPPELWTELSNPEALTRHLGELGEIRITGVEPETKVEWEADGASGVVHLKQSGWGTKVTLSLTREAPELGAPVEPEQIAEPEPAVDPEPEPTVQLEPGATVQLEHEPIVEPGPESVVEAEPQSVVEPEPEPETAIESEPQLGFFARMFRRRKARPVEVVEPEPEFEYEALAAPEAVYPARVIEPEPEPETPLTDLAAELASVEAQMEEETAELLTGVLDRLGAAHHRPFSRG